VVDDCNEQFDTQDIQIKQLANMVNDLMGKVEGQAKEIKQLKSNCQKTLKGDKHLDCQGYCPGAVCQRCPEESVSPGRRRRAS
jgi:hypothetical protein